MQKKKPGLPSTLKNFVRVTPLVINPLPKQQVRKIAALLGTFFLNPNCQTANNLLQLNISQQQWFSFLSFTQTAVGMPIYQTIPHKQSTLSFFPSHSTLHWLKAFCYNTMQVTKSNFVVSLRQGVGLTETLLHVLGLPVEFVQYASKDHCCDDHDDEEDEEKDEEECCCCCCSPNLREWPEEEKGRSTVLYTEWFPHVDTNRLRDYILRVCPEVICIAGPMDMLSKLDDLNTTLVCESKFQRQIYELDSLAYNHGTEHECISSVVLVVYCTNDISPVLSMYSSSMMVSPLKALRFHLQRHVFENQLAKWWSTVLPRMPLKLMLRHMPKFSCCEALIHCFMTYESTAFYDTECKHDQLLQRLSLPCACQDKCVLLYSIN